MERLEIEILATIGNFEKNINSAQTKLQEFGKATEKAGSNISNSLTTPLNTLSTSSTKAFAAIQQGSLKSAEALKLQRAQLQGLADLELKPQKLVAFNQQIERLTVEINKMSNAGKTGFDELGNAVDTAAPKAGKFEAAIGRVTNLSNIGATVVSRFSRQIIGLGVGILSYEIGAKAIQSIAEYVANLDIFTGRLNSSVQALKAFNEIQSETAKAAGDQLGPLRQLYDETQNTTLSIQDRTKAAQELRELYPDEFANLNNLAILNGQAKDSYNELTESIIKNATAAATAQQIGAQVSKVVAAKIEIQKLKNQHTQDIKDINAQGSFDNTNPNEGGGVTTGQEKIAADQRQRDGIKDQQAIIDTANGTITIIEQATKSTTDASKKLDKANTYLGENFKKFNADLVNANSESLLKTLQTALQTKLNSLAPNDTQIADLTTKLQKVDTLLKKYQVKKDSPEETQAKKIQKVYDDLVKGLDKNSVQFDNLNNIVKLSEDNIKTYQKAIDDLIQNGLKPQSKAVQDLIDKQSKLTPLTLGANPVTKELTLPTELKQKQSFKAIEINPTIIPKPIFDFSSFDTTLISELTEKLNADFEKLSQVILQSGVQDAFKSLGSSIGGAIANGTNLMQALGSSLLEVIGNIATKLGEAAVGIGVAMIGIKSAFTNPFTAIAAGIALIALGSFITSKVANMTKGSTSGNNTTTQAIPIRQFASGGIISGPTMGLMGEYAGARSNPEVVAPLNKLKGLLPSGGEQAIFIASDSLRGEDIYRSYKRVAKRMGDVS